MENITNAKTGNAYKGGNLKTLQSAMNEGGFSDPRFGTFNDFKAEGYWVKRGSKAAARIKGQHGTYCVFNVKQTTMPVVNTAGQEALGEAAAQEFVSHNEDEGDNPEQPEPTYEQAAESKIAAEQYAAF